MAKDKKNKNIVRGEAGWCVRLVRDGAEYSKYFRFSNGGVKKSLQQAQKWRDELIETLGPRKWKEGPRTKKAANNSSGVIGVSKNKYGRWVATWQEDKKQRFKTFPTKREAIAHRKASISQSK